MFDWNKMYKHEEQIERDIIERVEDYVHEFYGVNCCSELTKDQMNEVEHWRKENLNEYNVMQIGFSEIYNCWLSHQQDC